jgi:hypothetical protein
MFSCMDGSFGIAIHPDAQRWIVHGSNGNFT